MGAGAAVPAAMAGASMLGGMMGGGRSASASVPYGFGRASGPFGNILAAVMRDPRFAGGGAGGPGGLIGPSGAPISPQEADWRRNNSFSSDNQMRGPGRFRGPVGGIMGQALDFYSGLQNNPDIQAALAAYRSQAEDPTRLTNPLFLQEQERLGSTLNEEARRRGGLYSTGGFDMVSRGLSDFSNRYLAEAANRQLQAAGGLNATTMGLGQAMWTPFQMIAGAIPGLGGSSVIPPTQFSNTKAQGASTAGDILSNVDWSKT